jgi:transcriptional regulator with PAS, ATPase and Fis domain
MASLARKRPFWRWNNQRHPRAMACWLAEQTVDLATRSTLVANPDPTDNVLTNAGFFVEKLQGSTMERQRWTQGFPGAVTVCDAQGIILEMNDQSIRMFREQGGANLIGRNLLDCHPAPARAKLQEMLKSQATNVYTVEKNGARKFIYQAPWYADGQFGGIVELVLEIPGTIPHFVRQG